MSHEEHCLKGDETILIVEDEQAIRNIAKSSLQKFGYTTLTAADAEEALSVYANAAQKIDVLLTDVVMPNVSGKELADQLAVKQPDLVIIFMSGYTDDTIGKEGVLTENINFIQKPFSPASLAEKLRDILDHNR
ncbi:MAG: response regulator [candidate division KSB1 bacterium]|nr:response regulator [candidate division KSB1 bacterium]